MSTALTIPKMKLRDLLAGIKAHVEAADKGHERSAQLFKKSDDHLISAAQMLVELQGRTADWMDKAQEQCGLGRTRIYDLIKVGKGETTLEGLRAVTAARVQKARTSPLQADVADKIAAAPPAPTTVPPEPAAAPAKRTMKEAKKSGQEAAARGAAIAASMGFTVRPDELDDTGSAADPDDGAADPADFDEAAHIRQCKFIILALKAAEHAHIPIDFEVSPAVIECARAAADAWRDRSTRLDDMDDKIALAAAGEQVHEVPDEAIEVLPPEPAPGTPPRAHIHDDLDIPGFLDRRKPRAAVEASP